MELLKNGNGNAYFNRKKREMEDLSLISRKDDDGDLSEILVEVTLELFFIVVNESLPW